MMSGAPRNAALYAALRDYCAVVFERWRELYPSPETLPRATLPKVEIEGDRISYSTAVQVDVTWLLRGDDFDKDLPARAAAEAAMCADPRVARHLDTLVGTSAGMRRVDVSTCLHMVLWFLLKNNDALSFDEGRFAAVYDEMENYLYGDSVRLRCIAPLPHFTTEVDNIDLGTDFRLLRLDKAEREQALAEAQRFPAPGMYGLSYGSESFGLELIFSTPKIIGSIDGDPAPLSPFQVAQDRIQGAISALRLFKPGMVRYTVIRQTAVGWNPGMGTMASGGLTGQVPGPAYSLSTSEAHAFRAFWAEFQPARARKRPRLDLGLRRFNFAYDRLRPEDRLIDYVIALEALLTKREEMGELAYRLALRGSRLLGNTPAARSAVHARLRLGYRLRSEIVHGGEAPATVSVAGHTTSFTDFVEAIAVDLREAIKELMRRTETIDEPGVLAALDTHIVTG